MSAQEAKESRNLFTFVIRLLFLLATALGIFGGVFLNTPQTYMNSFIAFMGFALTFIPEAVEKVSNNKLRFSQSLEIAIVLFIFLAQFLGEMRDFYYRFPWWDTMLHLSSGIILGMVGFLMVYALNESDDIEIKMTPFFVVLFAFMFASTCGALWEIFEFGADRLVGANMQKYLPPEGTTELYTDVWRFDAGLIDTMADLICDTSTAFVVSLVGFFYLKRQEKIKLKSMVLKDK